MANEQKQSIDLRPGKQFSTALSNENLRIGDSSAWEAKIAGTLDPTRTRLDFEVGKGGVIKEIDKSISIPKRIKAILAAHGISDPNKDIPDEILNDKKKHAGTRTFVSFILQGSHDTMEKLAFGDQKVSYNPNADNSNLERKEEIEKWAKDMYAYIAQKYGEENIAEFTVHLDETTPHAHCVVVPITPSGKLSFKKVFIGEVDNKYEFSINNELFYIKPEITELTKDNSKKMISGDCIPDNIRNNKNNENDQILNKFQKNYNINKDNESDEIFNYLKNLKLFRDELTFEDNNKKEL